MPTLWHPNDWTRYPRSREGHAKFRVIDGDYFAVVSALLATRTWPNEDPIGKVIEYGNMDGDLRPVRMRTIDQIVSTSVADRRFTFAAIAAFSVAGLTLAMLGVYSLIAYLVTQRTRELGIQFGSCKKFVEPRTFRGCRRLEFFNPPPRPSCRPPTSPRFYALRGA
jgi:hypothetical protein